MWINYLFLITTCSLICTIHTKALENTKDEAISTPFNENDDKINDAVQSINRNQQAIIAIQIINSTAEGETKSGSNKKRTIETSLGYGGYQGNNFYYKTQDGKFEIYPYSQHDIPPKNHGKLPSGVHSNVDIQQAYSFIVGKKQQQQQQAQNYYYPRQKQQYHPEYSIQYSPENSGHHQQPQKHTTLFSTINQGQISSLSPNIPAQFVQYPVTPHGSTQQLQIPVIILRVYSDQLSHSNEIYPNLPANNPYASFINMINLQQLLNGYMQENAGYTSPQSHVPQIPQSKQQYITSPQYEEQPQQQYELPIAENYPKSTHTQVLLKPKKQYYKSPKAMGESVTTPTGFSYKAAPIQNQQQHAQYVYTNEATNQQYLAGGAQQYVAQGNQYSVPVIGAQNYYEYNQGYVDQSTQNQSPYNSPQQPVYETQQPVYATQQTVDYNEYIRQMTSEYPEHTAVGKPDEKDQTQYIYINEAELANHGYVYKNPSTGEYMYYPSMAKQHQQMTDITKYSLPDPSSEHHSTTAYRYTTPVSQAPHNSRLTVTEKSVQKQYNYHAQNPKHGVYTSSDDHTAKLSSAVRAKKNKSSTPPLVLAPHS